MDKYYYSVIEAIIFSSEEPIKSSDILKAFKETDEGSIELNSDSIEDAIKYLNNLYKDNEQSFRIIKIADGYIFATKPEYGNYLNFLNSEKSKKRLSGAALETLSIIAYKQPITKQTIEAVRGVGSDYILNTLLEKNLITISGRAEAIGRPLLYSTTDEFLKYFGLNSIKDLPKPREIEEIMQDDDFIEQKRKIMMNQIEETLEKEIDRGE